MSETTFLAFESPCFINGKPLLIVGLRERFSPANSTGIPVLWQRFIPHIGAVPGQQGAVAYGVMYNPDSERNFDYLAGVEVTDLSKVPVGFERVRIPEQRYAMFSHSGHISEIRPLWHTIWNKWFPESGQAPADGPMFEKYGERFDAQTGNGGFEIWVPIRR